MLCKLVVVLLASAYHESAKCTSNPCRRWEKYIRNATTQCQTILLIVEIVQLLLFESVTFSDSMAKHRHTTTSSNQLVHDSLAMKPELDLFTNRPLQICIEGSVWNDLKPISNVRENNPISFVISGNEDDFLDPVMNLSIRVKVKSSTGMDLPAESTVALVNLFVMPSLNEQI